MWSKSIAILEFKKIGIAGQIYCILRFDSTLRQWTGRWTLDAGLESGQRAAHWTPHARVVLFSMPGKRASTTLLVLTSQLSAF